MTTVPGVSNNELTRTTWGNAVATELNSRTIKVTGATEAGAGITGVLVINGSPALKLRRSTNTPYLEFENTLGTIRYGYIQGGTAEMKYHAEDADEHNFYVGPAAGPIVLAVTIDAGGIVLGAGKSVETTGIVQGGFGRFGNSTGDQVQVVDINGGGTTAAQAHISFYPNATSVAAIGAPTAYVGYAGEGFQLQASTALTLQSTTGPVVAEGTSFLVGKGAVNDATNGATVTPPGSLRSTVGDPASANLYVRRVGSASADGQVFAQFAKADGNIVAAITQDATAPEGVHFVNCTATAPSDYRLKNDLGPVVDPVARVMELAPKHLSWKAGGAEFDGFIAHEVQPVVPVAVTGDKDQVFTADEATMWGVEPGAIKSQQLDPTALVPLLTAALQDALTMISDLTDRVAVLEGV